MSLRNKEKPHILVVDDDPSVTASLGILLKQAGMTTTAAHDPAGALAALSQHPPDLIIQDMNFSRRTSGEEGLALLRHIKELHPDIPVILLTAWGSISLAVQGIKLGAFDFMTKPWDNEQVLSNVQTALSLRPMKGAAHIKLTREECDRRGDFTHIIGRDPALLHIMQTILRVAPTEATVLILGESGTGKESIAEAIHRNSKRRGQAYVKVNLGGISAGLFESEMFGHVRGAFTDAKQDRKGRFAMAHRGSIFLDEIGDLDPAAQVKMLRVLQERKFEVLGSSTTVTSDTRVISATNRDLAAMVEDGSFREDLFYRLNLITMRLPPLRERAGDIALLAHHFLANAAQAYGVPQPRLSAATIDWLQGQPWPGNIRQLKQTVERSLLISGTKVLDPEHFRFETFGAVPKPGGLPPVGSMTLDEMEREMVVKAIDHFEGNLTKVAAALGLSRAALYRRLEKYGIRL